MRDHKDVIIVFNAKLDDLNEGLGLEKDIDGFFASTNEIGTKSNAEVSRIHLVFLFPSGNPIQAHTIIVSIDVTRVEKEEKELTTDLCLGADHAEHLEKGSEDGLGTGRKFAEDDAQTGDLDVFGSDFCRAIGE